MMTRKKMLKLLGGLPLGGLLTGKLLADHESIAGPGVQAKTTGTTTAAALADPLRPDSIYRKVGRGR